MMNKKITLSERLGSMLLDHAIMCVIIVPPMILIAIVGISPPNHPPFDSAWIVGIPLFFVYFNKDFFRAKSPAKRILGFQVVDNTTGEAASRIQCFVRNITIPLWPIEVLVTLFSRQRRIGDLLAGTKLVRSEKEPLKEILKEIPVLRNYSK